MRFLSNELVFLKASDGTAFDTMTESLISEGIDIRTVYGCALQLKYTGTPVGQLVVQASCDEILPAQTQNWVTVTNSAQSISSAGDWIYNVADVNWGFIRILYTFTSGTGTLTGKVVTKGV
jgi:hypothetical protein